MMSVHDALQAWQDGDITASRAMALSGARNVMELYALANSCGVDIRLQPTEAEARVVDALSRAIVVRMQDEDRDPGGSGVRAA
jgi:hypothetical protein